MQQLLQLWRVHRPPEICVNFLLLNLPSLSHRCIKDDRKGLKQCHRWMVHLLDNIQFQCFIPKTQCCYPKPQQLGNMPWEVVSPCVQQKKSHMCDQQEHLKISQVWQHKLPHSSWKACCESELSVCSRCSPYSLLTALPVLFLIIDLLIPHCLKTFLFWVIFAESTACF